ncbi:MAG: hypothetical protein KKE94_16710 [Gammaproteobacteria bacterium]|nr:hypothetical protein [Gammaproteobacteria bacterium]
MAASVSTSADVAVNSASSLPNPGNKAVLWLLLLVLLLLYVYQDMAAEKEQVLDQNYYRILYETGNSFSIRIEQLARLHIYKAADETIRSQFPSYKNDNAVPERVNVQSNDDIQFEWRQGQLYVQLCISFNCSAFAERKYFDASLNPEDVLPEPKGGFSLLLLADKSGRVLAKTGEENAVSFADLHYLTKALADNKSFSLANLFKSAPATSDESATPSMPGVSRHIDIMLSYGQHRVYLYPLPLTANFIVGDNQLTDNLYVIGILPEQAFAAQKNNITNFQLMLVSVLSLLFVWTFIKVYLLPVHQAVPGWLISLCHLACFAFFSMLVAFVSAYYLEAILLSEKTADARQYAEKLRDSMREELRSAFATTAQRAGFSTQFDKQLKQCSDNMSASTVQQQRRTDVREPDAKPVDCYIDSLEGRYSVAFCRPENTSAANVAPLIKYGLFHPSLAVEQSADCKISSHKTSTTSTNAAGTNAGQLPAADYTLNITAIDADGSSSFPAFYLAEHHGPLRVFKLSHRDYYKKVRTKAGWSLRLGADGGEPVYHNSYVQRLFNVDSGTRGTTISMPLHAGLAEHNQGVANDKLNSAVLIADVFLPTLNISPPPTQDFTYMLVQRSSGDILYHSDNDRSLIENIYYAGPNTATVRDFVQTRPQQDVLDDHYHGMAGRFVKLATAVPDWELLVFFPARSLKLYALVWFVIFSMLPFVVLCLVWLAMKGVNVNSGNLKRRLGIVLIYRRRWLFLQLALVLSSLCAATLIYLALQKPPFSAVILCWLPVTWLVVFGSSFCLFKASRDATNNLLASSTRLFVLLLLLAAPAIYFLASVKDLPFAALQQYYADWGKLELKREQKELRQAALYLYPHSVMQHNINAAKLLNVDLLSTLAEEQQKAPESNSVATLEALPVLTSASGYQYFWQMIKNYLIDPAPDKATTLNTLLSWQVVRYLLVYIFVLLAMLVLFSLYVERILGARLCLSSAALRHLADLIGICAAQQPDTINSRLTIQFKAVSLNGVDISAALHSDAHQFQRQLVALLALSRVLRSWQKNITVLPSLKLWLTYAENGKLQVVLSDIEVCLEQRQSRQHLLEFLQELKALTLADKLQQVELVSGFHSFQHLAIKDAFKVSDRKNELDHTEYLAWSECLLDFKVILPERLRAGKNITLLHWETKWCPHLRMLLQQDGYPLPLAESATSQPVGFRQILSTLFRASPNDADVLAAQAYVLCHADAFYRFKWENCTKDEQLALYNLALGHQLNPLNITMIQNLALNGVLRVCHGQLKLVNSTFRQFVLNAEPQHKLQALVREGEAGVWQQHRLTFAAIILTLIVGIAMTSGQSLHIIAISVAGILSALVSVFSNASALRGHFKP